MNTLGTARDPAVLHPAYPGVSSRHGLAWSSGFGSSGRRHSSGIAAAQDQVTDQSRTKVDPLYLGGFRSTCWRYIACFKIT